MITLKPSKPAKTRAARTGPAAPSKPPQKLDALMRLMTRETGKAIQFEFAAHPDSKVYIAGTFNNWNPTTHPLDHHPEDGVFKATLHLPAGAHEYKFVVNGVWHLDDKCPHRVPNSHGGQNSVIHV